MRWQSGGAEHRGAAGGRCKGKARPPSAIIAPEVAARIVARRAAGEPLSVLTHDLHMTPGEIRAVLAGP